MLQMTLLDGYIISLGPMMLCWRTLHFI